MAVDKSSFFLEDMLRVVGAVSFWSRSTMAETEGILSWSCLHFHHIIDNESLGTEEFWYGTYNLQGCGEAREHAISCTVLFLFYLVFQMLNKKLKLKKNKNSTNNEKYKLKPKLKLSSP